MALDSADSYNPRIDDALLLRHDVPSGNGDEVVGGLTLLIDADDTLWENNIYFLEVTERFLEALDQFGIDREQARVHLVETERSNIPLHGYGSRAFAISVEQAFRALSPVDDPSTLELLRSLAHSIFERDFMEIRAGVCETLSLLARHHRLVLVTKGDREEQEWKLECSGLRHHFQHVEVVGEKDVHTYRMLIDRLDLNPSRTWMIGNSPRSDINPALAAGLNAVLVPHPQTWELELEDVQEAGGRLVVVESLSDVLALFLPSEGRRTADS